MVMSDANGQAGVNGQFDDTWLIYGIGAMLEMGENNQVYVDIERGEGSGFTNT